MDKIAIPFLIWLFENKGFFSTSDLISLKSAVPL